MRFNQQEKYEIIRIVEDSEIGVRRTLRELGIHRSTFYNWYGRYKAGGFNSLASKRRKSFWNRIPPKMKNEVVELALDLPHLSPRELACHIVDNKKYFISESSVYRILKSRGLITSPAYLVMMASDSFKDKTHRPNEMWQTDFTYFKIVGCGWYYLSTVLDDYSRYIISWELCKTMKATDVQSSLDMALKATGLALKPNKPKLLSDNGSCYISKELSEYMEEHDMKHVRGRPNHPQTQGKIERYHRSMKNVIKLEHYYSTEELERRLAEFIDYYNNDRYHESLENCTPSDVYHGRHHEVLKKRKQVKLNTMKKRRKMHLLQRLNL